MKYVLYLRMMGFSLIFLDNFIFTTQRRRNIVIIIIYMSFSRCPNNVNMKKRFEVGFMCMHTYSTLNTERPSFLLQCKYSVSHTIMNHILTDTQNSELKSL